MLPLIETVVGTRCQLLMHDPTRCRCADHKDTIPGIKAHSFERREAQTYAVIREVTDTPLVCEDASDDSIEVVSCSLNVADSTVVMLVVACASTSCQDSLSLSQRVRSSSSFQILWSVLPRRPSSALTSIKVPSKYKISSKSHNRRSLTRIW